MANYSDINGSFTALLIRANPIVAEGLPAVANPIGYTQIWTDERSKASKNGSFWRPIPPNGYVGLGDVAKQEWSPAPSLNDVWCVREDLSKQGSFGAHSVWDDRKSGAKTDVSVWEIRSARRFDTDAVTGDLQATHLGAIHAHQGYNAPDYSLARVPIV